MKTVDFKEDFVLSIELTTTMYIVEDCVEYQATGLRT